MICPYCEQEVNTRYCPHCGALQELPKQPSLEQSTQKVPQAPVNINVTFSAPEMPPMPSIPPMPGMPNIPNVSGFFAPVCPRCGSRETYSRRRGYRWGLAILGFFLIPVWGLLLGFIGSRKTVQYCPHCKKKFKLTHP